ncbi:acyl-CoA dehydrogenase family protein [Rhodococcus sp. IEGM 1381]|uniref:acyl-CoA dehydrogenase family protein n=1 Tax=Rhodococcus sp. IEGM 1381 TaxID=3047085 RepID=UPI0024B82856|nr:acyl-CoA dehydrogenase family protein [Rhodococcus sp. IEGM 1381]MDI9893185.1 acyl-CoA dehydrogenase family protein [Rhodococcus sp. IEGM 1381]
MFFELSPEQQKLRDTARQFADDHLYPLAESVKKATDPFERALLARPVFEKAVAAGFLKGLIPAPFGGSATNGVDTAIFIEEFACASPDFTISLAGPTLALAPVIEAGTPEQIKRFVAPFLADTGSPVAAMAYSEPGGSANFDAATTAEGTRTTAVIDGDHWVLNGEKMWASHLGGWDDAGPDITGLSIIVVEREHLSTGFSVLEHLDLPGLKGCLTSRVKFDNVRVPLGNLIGEQGQGADLTRNAFLASGASIASFSVAAMRQAFAAAYAFAVREKRGGAVPIIDHQAVADVLTDCKGKIEATRLLAWRALDAAASRHPSALELALHAKIFGSETAVDVITDLIKIVGVESYNPQMPLMGYLEDALAYPVIEGSNSGVRRRQMHELMRTSEWNPLSASGLI